MNISKPPPPPGPPPRRVLYLRLSPELVQDLHDAAERFDVSVNGLCDQLLTQALDQLDK